MPGKQNRIQRSVTGHRRSKDRQSRPPRQTAPPSVMVVAHSLSPTRVRAPTGQGPRMPIPAEERSALHPLPSRTPRASPQGPSGNGRPNLFTMSNSGGQAALGQVRSRQGRDRAVKSGTPRTNSRERIVPSPSPPRRHPEGQGTTDPPSAVPRPHHRRRVPAPIGVKRRPSAFFRSPMLLVTDRCPAPWWSRTGSNRRPPACKAGALPTELRPRTGEADRWSVASNQWSMTNGR